MISLLRRDFLLDHYKNESGTTGHGLMTGDLFANSGDA